MELSNNISERRCELKSNETVSEQSERASGYIVGFMTGSNEVRVSRKSGVYYIISAALASTIFVRE